MGNVYVLLCVVAAYGVALTAGTVQRTLLPWLLAGVTLRCVMFTLVALEWWSPPNSSMDALGFIRLASSLSVLPWSELLATLDYRSATSYAVLGAMLFKTIGYHPFAMQATNLVLGTINMCLAVLLVRRYIGEASATGAAVILCLYPFSAFNSVVALREELAIFLFLCGLSLLMRWSRRGDIMPFLAANVGFALAAFVHPGFIGALIAATGFFVVSSLRSMKKGGDRRSALVSALVGMVMFMSSLAVFASGLELGKGIALTLDPDEMYETLGSKFQRQAMGGSAYPAVLAEGDPVRQPWLIPARMAYLLYSPFIWDVRSAVHIVGLIVGVFYIWLSIRAWRAWRERRIKGRMRVLGWVLVGLTLVFGMGTNNSGTAVRHKTKFFSLLVLLAAPTFSRRIVFGASQRDDPPLMYAHRQGVIDEKPHS